MVAAGSGSCPSCAAHPGVKKGGVHAKAVLGSTCLQVDLTLLGCSTA